MKSIHFGGIVLLCCLACGQAGLAFDIADYFPLAAGNTWSYTGEDQLGSSIEDDFTWTIPAELQVVAGGQFAFRMVTDTVEPTDGRDMDEDFWTVDGQGRLLFHGFRNGKADTFAGGNFPVQNIICQWPVLVGRRNLVVGNTITSTTRATVQIGTLIGTQNIPTTITVTTNYDRIDPVVLTPAGTFYDVLHLVINLRVQAVVFGQPVNQEFRGSEIWLAQGVGMVMQDQKAQPDDGRVQALAFARVNGREFKNAERAWWVELD